MKSPIQKLFSLVFALATLVSASSTQAAPEAPLPPAATFRQWGAETQAAIDRHLWLPERTLYAEKTTVGQPAKDPAFMWGVGVQLTALAAAARLEPKTYEKPLRAYTDAIKVYWNDKGPVPGYDVLPGPKPVDRYYDDNAWVVLALLEISEITGEKQYRRQAEATFKFVMSGEDNQLGGGLYWKEVGKDSKNTCINAPAIVAALRLYRITKKRDYLQAAQRLYTWTNAHLQDADALYWDNVKLDGKLDRTKFSYNSALMIRANGLFYQITKKPEYLAEAQRIARASEGKWVVAETGALADGGRFAHLLTDSLLELYALDKDPRWLRLVGNGLVYLHNQVRDPNGFYADRWDRPRATALKEITLLDLSSAARAYWSMARVLEK